VWPIHSALVKGGRRNIIELTREMSLLLLLGFLFRWLERRYGLLTVFLLYSVTFLPEALTVIRFLLLLPFLGVDCSKYIIL
jgi:hypothetical protein